MMSLGWKGHIVKSNISKMMFLPLFTNLYHISRLIWEICFFNLFLNEVKRNDLKKKFRLGKHRACAPVCVPVLFIDFNSILIIILLIYPRLDSNPRFHFKLSSTDQGHVQDTHYEVWRISRLSLTTVHPHQY